MSTLAFVPVRGNSKSIPLKNIKLFGGKPLLFWVLNALQHAVSIDEIIVATDNKEIKETVKGFAMGKVNLYDRDPKNAQDESSTESVMLEYIEKHNVSHETDFVLAQATSPLTTADQFDEAISLYKKSNIDSMLSVVLSKRFYWGKNGKPLNYDYKHRPRRQNFDGSYIENGAFYINKVKNILAHKNRLSGVIGMFEMPQYTLTEIDEPEDWDKAEKFLYEYYENKNTSKIKLFLSDVDGVLTDGSMYYTEKGDELKRFHTYDGMGFNLLKGKNILRGLLTKENRKLNERRGKKLQLDYIIQGIDDKLNLVTDFIKGLDIKFSEVAYIGDDINDIELLKAVGIKACPSNARKEVKDIPGIIHLSSQGGEGVIREFVDILCKKNWI